MKKVAVIGSGLGGLSSAVHLAKLGYSVDIFEKNSLPGGKVGEISFDGYRFDTGPSILTMPFILKELFEFAGFNIDEHLEIEPVEPICRNFFPNEKFVDTSPDTEAMQQQITQFSPTDAENYPKYLDYSKKIYDNSAQVFLYEPFHEVGKLFKEKKMPSPLDVFKLDVFRTVHDANSSFFKNENIVKIFDRYATYNGSSPYMAPATLNNISHVELNLGAYYVKGGIYRIVEALTAILEKMNVNINFNTPVDEILTENNSVKGISVNGEKIDYDNVVSNADVVYTHNHLLNGQSRRKYKLNKLEPSLSAMLFLWGVDKTFDGLKHHNVIFPENYRQEFIDIFDRKKAPEDPAIYISITSKSDPSHAPEGCENWYVLVNMPYLTGNNGAKYGTSIKKILFKKLKQSGFDLENHIAAEKIIEPVDFEGRHNSNRGSIYGISSNTRMTAFKRPANRSRDIEGLYFASGSSHPGGGIPLVLLSGRHCANLIRYRDRS